MHATRTVTALRSSLARRHSNRLSRRRLTDELAGFTTASDWLELEAMVARHSAEDAGEVRTIMSGLAAKRSRI